MFTGGIGSSNPPFAIKNGSPYGLLFLITKSIKKPETPRSGGEGARGPEELGFAPTGAIVRWTMFSTSTHCPEKRIPPSLRRNFTKKDR